MGVLHAHYHLAGLVCTVLAVRAAWPPAMFVIKIDCFDCERIYLWIVLGIAKGFTCGLCWVLRKDLLWVTPEGMPTLTIIGKKVKYDITRIIPYRSQVTK
jgi:hypothetical protein